MKCCRGGAGGWHLGRIRNIPRETLIPCIEMRYLEAWTPAGGTRKTQTGLNEWHMHLVDTKNIISQSPDRCELLCEPESSPVNTEQTFHCRLLKDLLLKNDSMENRKQKPQKTIQINKQTSSLTVKWTKQLFKWTNNKSNSSLIYFLWTWHFTSGALFFQKSGYLRWKGEGKLRRFLTIKTTGK